MTTWLKHRVPAPGGRFLDHLIVWLAALFVVAGAAFGGYYYWDHYLSREAPAAPKSVEAEIASYEEAVRTSPNDATARMALAQLYFNHKRYADAVQQYQAVLTLDAQNTRALDGLGRSLFASGKGEEAVASFQKVIDQANEVDVSSAMVESAHYYLGSIALEQARPDEAVTHLKEAVAIERTDADAWYQLGVAYLAAGSVDDAISALSQAVLFVPKFPEAYDKMATAYEQKGLEPETRYARGMRAYSNGHLDEAAREVEGALQASTTSASFYVGLGLIREAQGKRDLAIAAFQSALELEPENFHAQSGLARLSPAGEPASSQQQGVSP